MVDAKQTPVTREGLERLKDELRELKEVRRPQIVAAIAEARSHGDLRENAGYDAAKHDQAMVEKKIADIESLIRNATIIDDQPQSGPPTAVRLGSTVVVEIDGDEERYTIVGAIEAKPAAGLISNESPVGRALLGKEPGANAVVQTPRGQSVYRIVRIES
ncbi:MAG TPA: transcription elongation factor GreA [Thermomicrobiales bacterium]|nr:transcription elongation factor GreA [Thermomicrobiales bacterium]